MTGIKRMGAALLLAVSVFSPASAEVKELTIVVQINGKVRTKLQVPTEIENQALEQLALADDKISKLIEGKTPKKVIVVQKKLVNIVL